MEARRGLRSPPQAAPKSRGLLLPLSDHPRRYSRHPNHLGEQTWWVGLLTFGVAAAGGARAFASDPARWLVCFGVLFNHPLDTLVTLPLIEERMLRRPERAAAYRAYQRRVALLVPWPRRVLGTKEG